MCTYASLEGQNKAISWLAFKEVFIDYWYHEEKYKMGDSVIAQSNDII